MSIYFNNELVKPCPNFPNYGASYEGNVYRLSTGKMMTKTVAQDGYYDIRVCHDNQPRSVKYHLVVADAWLPYIEGKTVVNHKNGNKQDPRVCNLERCTPAYNQRHAVSNGLKGVGEKLYNAQLTDAEVHEVCQLLTDGMTLKSISDKYGVSKDIIRKIKSGDSYPFIRILYTDIPHKYKNELSEATIRWVCLNILKGLADKTIADISNNENITTAEVKRIRHKIRYRNISDEYFID